MKTRIIASIILLPIFFCILFVFPPYILTLLISVISAIASYELLNATKSIKNKRILVYTIIAAIFTPIAVYLSALTPYAPLMQITLMLSIFFIFISLLMIEFVLTFRNTKALEAGIQVKLHHILIALAAGIVIPYMLASLISLRTMPQGHFLVLLPIIATILTDSGAYFVGVSMGKTKAFPTISPNKTVEGYIGGIITGTLAMAIYGAILASTTTLNIIFPALLLYGIIGAIVTGLGDLLFSLIKRKCEVKDYGNLIPGHGGILDRFDSMTLTAPTMYLLVTLLPAIIM